MPDEIIGGVGITVSADLSDLQGQFDSAVGIATQAGEDIAGALNSASASDATSTLSQSLTEVASSAEEAGSQIAAMAEEPQTLAEYFDQLDAAAASASSSTGELTGTLDQAAAGFSEASTAASEAAATVNEAGHAAEEAEGHFGGLRTGLIEMAEAFAFLEGLKEFAADALETYGAVQKASISLTALTGSAKQANETIENLKSLALSDALNFEQLVAADQRMTAFGVSAEKIPELLESAANAAAATGEQFQSTADSLVRIAAAGQVSGRFLLQLGLTTADLGRVMGVTGAQVATAFRAMDQSERLDVLNSAMQKFAGVSAAVANSIPGQWQNLKTQFDFVLEDIGAALAPVASQLMSFAQDVVIPAVKGITEAFNELPAPAKTAAIAIVGIVAIVGPAILGITGIINTVHAAYESIVGVAEELRSLLTQIAEAQTAAAEATATATEATEADTVALTENTEALVANAAEAKQQSVAVGEAAGATETEAGAAGTAASSTRLFSGALGTLGSVLAPLVEVLGLFAAGTAVVKYAIEAVTGEFISWKDAALDLIDPLNAASREMAALSKEHTELADTVKGATDKLDAEGQKLRDADTSYRQVASAANLAADSHEAWRLKLEGLSTALQTARVHLQAVSDDMHAGRASADDLTKALDEVEKAQSALTAAQTKAAGPEDILAERAAQFRMRMAELPSPIALVSDAVADNAAELRAHDIVLESEGAAIISLEAKLPGLVAGFNSGTVSAATLKKALDDLAKAKKEVDVEMGTKAIEKLQIANPVPVEATSTALSTLTEQVGQLPAFIPTLESVDQEWTKQSGHVSKLAKTDLPAAIAAYDAYIGQLEAVGAPLGQIYAAQEKELTLEISMAAERGADATDQIIQLTNIKEHTAALTDQSEALGNVYAGLMKTFDDTFSELDSQLTSAITGTESFGTAMHNVVMKMASDIVNTLVHYALGQLKDAIVGVTSSAGGLGASIGAAVGKLAGGGGGGVSGAASGAQMQTAVTQFHAAVVQFQAADTQFHTAVTQFSTADTQFHTGVTQFGTHTTSFGTQVTNFATQVGQFTTDIGQFDTDIGMFDTDTANFDVSVGDFDVAVGDQTAAIIEFQAAVVEFHAAVTEMAITGGGGIFSLFGFQGGGEVPGTVLGLLHPQEMVLPPNLAEGMRALIDSGKLPESVTGSVPGLNAGTVNINVQPSASTAEALGGASPSLSVPDLQQPSVNVSGPDMRDLSDAVGLLDKHVKALAPNEPNDEAASGPNSTTFERAAINFGDAVDSFSKAAKSSSAPAVGGASPFGGVSGVLGIFEQGGLVPQQMFALLHPEEMVLPRNIASPLQGLIASGKLGNLTNPSAPVTANVNLVLPSVSAPSPSLSLPSLGTGSTNAAGLSGVTFEHCTFTGVTQELVNDIMNKAVRGTRLAGARW